MWVVRELARLLVRIAVAAALAILLAGLWTLGSGGGFVHDLRIMFFLFGALLILLAGAGNRASASNRRVNWGVITPGRGGVLSQPVFAHVEGPQLTASAVFIGSAGVLFVLGFLV